MRAKKRNMGRCGAALAAASICLLAGLLAPGAANAAAPGWTIAITPIPANFAPGKVSEYAIIATNVGGAPTTGEEIELTTTIPAGMTIDEIGAFITDRGATDQEPTCTALGQVVSCTSSEAIHPGYVFKGKVSVKVPALTPPATLIAGASVKGGGATQEVSASAPTAVQEGPIPFDFLPGFAAPATDADAGPETLAGGHPFQQTISFGFPTEKAGEEITNDGHPRDFYIELPRGMVGSPAASEVLCTEAELTFEGCPKASQVGIADVTTLGGAVGNSDILSSGLYNMVPPPGTPAQIATNVANVGVFVHSQAEVRSDEDFGVEVATRDVIAFGQQPIFNVQAQVWGSPTAAAHDEIRGECAVFAGTCPVEPRSTAFLTNPTQCPGAPPLFEVLADTWEEPSPPSDLRRATYESADLAGNPVNLDGCDELDFEPRIEAKPTTNITDSPSGLDFVLHQSTDTDFESRSPAPLKDIAVRFPVGMVVNPSQAAGLGACAEAQIGYRGEEEGNPRFSEAPQSCPDAAKLGTVEVSSPVLVARNAAHEVEEKEGKPVLESLNGSIYIAKPYANPFDSLIAVYLAVEDEKTGIVAKLAGKGELDPVTGQLTTSFVESPELPIEDIGVHVLGGARGAFVTPPTCGVHMTAAELTPWSTTSSIAESDSFGLAGAPQGGPCPFSEAQMPFEPKLSAETVNPAAGKYSPLLFKLSREDGTQRLARIEATLPKGLSAKLAGIGTCSEAQIAKAKGREAPNQGAAELADPSCPSASEIGTVVASAGAGPTPYYASGHAYLAGPYKGAPLSFVSIAPAIAGPFDLGTVVVRAALYLDPESAQGRVVSDPLPQILQGVPVDLRSVAVRATRPGFILNPTSCDNKSFNGQAISALGSIAPLTERFQMGGCSSLLYKPKLTAKLFGPIHRGGHPRLRTVFTARAGDANTARISFALPKSEFIDQAHFRTICTRVQFAANQCPAGSVYGHIEATSPLVDYTVEGPIYLRSSPHKLPDVVATLRGPASQPIEVDLAGRVDSVNGGIRTTFEVVPDLPVTRAVVTLQGGKKGLFQNSTNICKGTHRATLKLDAQNGKVSDTQPKLVAQCKGKKGKGKKGKGKGGGGGAR